MPAFPSSPARRLATGLAAGVLMLVPVAGCSSSSAGVSCSGSSCTVTLSGGSASVRVLGQSLTFAGVQDGRASLGVGGRKISCSQGESVSAGPLTLACTTVEADRVQLTARLG